MKKLIPLFLLILLFNIALIDHEVKSDHTITFKTCDVEKSKVLLKTKPYREVVINKTVIQPNKKDRSNAIFSDTILNYEEKSKLLKDESYYPDNTPNRILESCSTKNTELVETDIHSFIEAVHTAYAQHYPLEISPDMIWLLIAQGFAIHVNENAEALRKQFVNFEGKKNIDIRRDDFKKGYFGNNWEGVFPEFSDKIGDNVGVELVALVTTEFSTTTIAEKAAFQVTLMDAMKSYFSYSMSTACGIPEITLSGTPEDWASLKERAQLLTKYDLDWWIKDLLPVLDEFKNASNGKINSKFWESIYKLNSPGSGNSYITGWILKLFPYLKGGPTGFIKNATLNIKSKNEGSIRIETDDFPSGLSQADFLWEYHDVPGKVDYYKMEFLAGFMGYSQNKKTLALRPEISWAVVDKRMKASEEEIEAKKKGGDKKYLKNLNKN